MEMHVLSLSPHVSSHSFSAIASRSISSSTMVDPNQVSQLVWMGSELWIVPKQDVVPASPRAT